LEKTCEAVRNLLGISEEEALQRIVTEWVMYRTDGYLKTLMFAERAGEEAFRVFVAYKLGVDVSDPLVEEETRRLLMFVHVHEDINPADDTSWGGEEPKTLVETMVGNSGKPGRGYTLHTYDPVSVREHGAKIIVSTADPEASESGSTFKPEEVKRWTVKTVKWAITGRFIEQFLRDQGKEDAVVVNLDRDHF